MEHISWVPSSMHHAVLSTFVTETHWWVSRCGSWRNGLAGHRTTQKILCASLRCAPAVCGFQTQEMALQYLRKNTLSPLRITLGQNAFSPGKPGFPFPFLENKHSVFPVLPTIVLKQTWVKYFSFCKLIVTPDLQNAALYRGQSLAPVSSIY